MPTEKESRAPWRRWLCKLIGHDPTIDKEELLDGEDYMEVTFRCKRCQRTEQEIYEYNEVTEP